MELIESPRSAQYCVSEAESNRSKDNIVVANGAGVLVAGTVLGTVTASGEYNIHDPAALDGTEVASAILLHEVDATAAAADGVAHVRAMQYNRGEVTYITGITQPDIDAAEAALEAQGIIARDGVDFAVSP